jgi:hypothetical protein
MRKTPFSSVSVAPWLCGSRSWPSVVCAQIWMRWPAKRRAVAGAQHGARHQEPAAADPLHDRARRAGSCWSRRASTASARHPLPGPARSDARCPRSKRHLQRPRRQEERCGGWDGKVVSSRSLLWLFMSLVDTRTPDPKRLIFPAPPATGKSSSAWKSMPRSPPIRSCFPGPRPNSARSPTPMSAWSMRPCPACCR